MTLVNAKWLKLTGNTYPHRDKIRELGATFDKEQRCWWVNYGKHALNTVKFRKQLEEKVWELARLGVVIERSETCGAA